MPADTACRGTRHRARIESDRLDRETDLVAFEHADEPIRVVRMSMRQRDDVDPTSPRRETGAELRQESRWVRSPIDEHCSAAHLDEERVALANVEGPYANAARRWPELRRRDDDEGDRHERSARPPRTPTERRS